MTKRRIGVIGYGNLGQQLVKDIFSNLDKYELAFVWNRTVEVLEKSEVNSNCILADLDDFEKYNPDLVIEVAHPSISKKYGQRILKFCDYMIGSPSALSDQELEIKLRSSAIKNGLYVPSGAFWGGEDINKMADLGTLRALKVTMKKHPSSLKLVASDIKDKNDELLQNQETASAVLYDGPVRELCKLAPSNVNTMAAAAIAGHNLGFDEVQGCLVADCSLKDWHIVEVDVCGPTDSNGNTFHVNTVRKNPANIGAVTGKATLKSFISSMRRAHGKGPGVHLC